MFKQWFWNLLLFAINVFGFILLAWFISGMVMNSINNPKNFATKEIITPQNYNYTTTNVCFQNNCITAQIADTTQKQEYGLMYRTKIDNTQGMLFVFQQETLQSFYMKNMYFPIEIMWLDQDGRINHVDHAVPCKDENCTTYSYNAMYVLEVNEGFMEDNNIILGDYVTIELSKKE